jgi:ABC-type amino acid transport substrate-binding protein
MKWKELGGNMKRILLLVLFLCALATITAQECAGASNPEGKTGNWGNALQKVKARGKLIAGVPGNEPPFGFVDEKGTLQGIDIDIGKVLAKAIFGNEDKVVFIPIPVEKRMDFLTSGKIDILLSPLFITEKRKRVIDFSVPYLVSGHLIVVQEDSKILKYQSLAGKRVAVIQETTGKGIIQKLIPTAKPVSFQRNQDALQALKEHKVDAFVQLDVFVFYIEGKGTRLHIIDLRPIDPSPIGLGFRKGDKEFVDFVNITLLKMMATGEYRGLLEKWFKKVRAEFLDLALEKEIKMSNKEMK